MANARPINNIVSANAVSVNDVSSASGRSETQVNNASVASTEYWYEQSRYYAGQAAESASSASASAQIAINNAGLAELSANAASTSESNAHVWAEGDDAEVEELGGVHSAKSWAEYVVNNAPTVTVEQTQTGAVITATDLQGTTTATILNGAKGDKGDKGDTGATGPQGSTGPQGQKGDKGDKGEQGIQGEKGNTGIVISETEPTDPEVEIWLKPSGAPVVPLINIDGGRANSVFTTVQRLIGGNAWQQ